MTEGWGMTLSLRCDAGSEVESASGRSMPDAWEKAKAKGWTCEATPWGTLTLCPEHSKELRGG